MKPKPSEIIKTFKATRSAVATARLLDIHRSTVYRWKRKARAAYRNHPLSTRGLHRHSTRPHTIHRKVSLSVESAIIAVRKTKGYTADKIRFVLDAPVSSSTIHRVLKRRRLIHQYGNHIRPRYQPTIHMHAKNVHTVGYLQMDVKHVTPELSGLTWTCYEYAIIDIHSRYKEAVILNQLDQDGAISALIMMLSRLPFKPVFIQTDNGLEFQGRFDALCQELKLPHHCIHKHSPNENALIERSFRTDEEEFFFWMKRAPKDYDELRTWFAAWLKEYNTYRPHLGIGLQTPYRVIQLSQMS
jgi:transposase InsO family protein